MKNDSIGARGGRDFHSIKERTEVMSYAEEGESLRVYAEGRSTMKSYSLRGWRHQKPAKREQRHSK